MLRGLDVAKVFHVIVTRFKPKPIYKTEQTTSQTDNMADQPNQDFITRKIKFKAWDQEHKLLMRLNSIECSKGELIKKNHILLQFTGLLDKEGEEIYDMDILFISLDKYVVFWSETKNGWYYSPLANRENQSPFLMKDAEKMKRFGNFFELSKEALDFKKTIF